jgi:hypothetical protein
VDLSRIAIVPRLRTGWEAIDLGFVLAKTWYRELFLAWGIPYLLLFLPAILILASFPDWGPNIALLGIWWVKPLVDRIPLHIISRQLFGDKTTVPEAINQAPQLMRRDWLLALTWRRFSPTRSFDLAVTVLEGLSGQQRTRRLSGLHRKASGSAIALTLFCVASELVLLFGFYAAISLLVPEQVEFDSQSLFNAEGYYATVFSGLAAVLASCLVAPFYVSAGFTLYISRRIELEAWDIEVRFRDLSNRLNKPDKLKQLLSIASAFVLGLGVLAHSPDAMADYSDKANSILDAEETVATSADPSNGPIQGEASSFSRLASRQRIAEILDHDDFHRREMKSGYRLKDDQPEDKAEEQQGEQNGFFYRLLKAIGNLLEPLGYFSSSLSALLELLLWIVAVSVFIYVLWYFRDSIKEAAGWRPPKRTHRTEEKPEVLFGLEVSEETIQENVTEKVLTLFQQGEARVALSLLYGSTLARLLHHHGCFFHDGMTEGECLRVVGREAKAQSNHFQQLTATWIQLAYAHREPDLECIQALCADWEVTYAQASE